MSFDASKVQDAYHYALAALGGSHPLTGEESAFTSNDEGLSRTAYLRKAYLTAKEAGCTSVRAPRSLADAMNMVTNIKLDARANGIDAHGGEPLCTSCMRRQRDTGCDGLCFECYGAASNWRARGDSALANLSGQDAAALGEPVRSGLKFTEHPDSRQATKKDLVDIANAIGRPNIINMNERLFSVPEIRASIRRRLHHLNEEGKLCEPHNPAPQFTHAELMQLFNAIAQYVENHDGEPVVPAAESAHDKLDAYVSKL